MKTVQEIKIAIKQLDGDALRELSDWLDNYLTEKWEGRFAKDVKAGKLDNQGEAADRAFERGKVRPL